MARSCGSSAVARRSASSRTAGYEQQELLLASGDRLLLFTDGVTESCNAKGEELGDDRLIALGRLEADADALHRRVVEARKAFSPAAPQDDVTVVTLGID